MFVETVQNLAVECPSSQSVFASERLALESRLGAFVFDWVPLENYCCRKPISYHHGLARIGPTLASQEPRVYAHPLPDPLAVHSTY